MLDFFVIFCGRGGDGVKKRSHFEPGVAAGQALPSIGDGCRIFSAFGSGAVTSFEKTNPFPDGRRRSIEVGLWCWVNSVVRRRRWFSSSVFRLADGTGGNGAVGRQVVDSGVRRVRQTVSSIPWFGGRQAQIELRIRPLCEMERRETGCLGQQEVGIVPFVVIRDQDHAVFSRTPGGRVERAIHAGDRAGLRHSLW